MSLGDVCELSALLAGDEIDVESGLENLRKRGYKVKVSSESQSSC